MYKERAKLKTKKKITIFVRHQTSVLFRQNQYGQGKKKKTITKQVRRLSCLASPLVNPKVFFLWIYCCLCYIASEELNVLLLKYLSIYRWTTYRENKIKSKKEKKNINCSFIRVTFIILLSLGVRRYNEIATNICHAPHAVNIILMLFDKTV